MTTERLKKEMAIAVASSDMDYQNLLHSINCAQCAGGQESAFVVPPDAETREEGRNEHQ